MLPAGKTALITGAANRLGAQIARTLHQNGANLIIHYRNSASNAEALTCELNDSRTATATCLQADLNDLDALEALAQSAAKCFQGIDILINNASSFYPTAIDEICPDHWEDLIGSNLKAPLFLSKACYPYLRKRGGVIINMLDIHATSPLKHHSIYCAAKAGNAMLVKSLALDLAPEVRVNGIAPGAILWPQNTTLAPEQREQMLQKIPLQALGDTESITGTVMFLLRNDYITGEIVRVDGGRLIGSLQA